MAEVKTLLEVRETHVALLGDMRDQALGMGKNIEVKLDVIAARLLVVIDLLQEIADNTKKPEIIFSDGGTETGGN